MLFSCLPHDGEQFDPYEERWRDPAIHGGGKEKKKKKFGGMEPTRAEMGPTNNVPTCQMYCLSAARFLAVRVRHPTPFPFATLTRGNLWAVGSTFSPPSNGKPLSVRCPHFPSLALSYVAI